MLVTGIGVGLAFVSVTMAATSGVPDRDQGIASGLIGTAQQVGMAVGLAILVNIAGSVTRVSIPEGAGAVIAGYHQAFVIAASISFVAAIIALIVMKRPSGLPSAGVAETVLPRPDSATQRLRPEPVAAGEVRTLTSTGVRWSGSRPGV
jgi:sugar phosphate permease